MKTSYCSTPDTFICTGTGGRGTGSWPTSRLGYAILEADLALVMLTRLDELHRRRAGDVHALLDLVASAAMAPAVRPQARLSPAVDSVTAGDEGR
ncbi:hypothetical protein Pa4123_55310 [Phytohabitans aurantiacus]|uniref:Resolvase/invertase-type recombinase catalytic domain-containing protein n=1 Tax=Phytohabitans aurantiacus TaxID=3016789 RepID=A0ABQ5R0N6_9ACTN|nr:hypothetical protein Pa4123_55310 [Phytohabitans aurantiacus]